MKFLPVRLLVGSLFLACGSAGAKAQSAGGNAPEGPLLRPAPEFSQWSVDFSYPQDRPDPAAGAMAPLDPLLPRKIVTTRTRGILREEIQTTGGTTLDNWQQNGNYYRKFPGNAFWSAYDKPTQLQIESGAAVIMTIPDGGFRDLEWIGRDSYAGEIAGKDSSYLIFLPPESRGIDLTDAKALQQLPTVAYVDAKTRLPVRVKVHGVVRVFKFLPPPSAMQTIPADLAAEIRKGDEIRAKAQAAPAKEY